MLRSALSAGARAAVPGRAYVAALAGAPALLVPAPQRAAEAETAPEPPSEDRAEDGVENRVEAWLERIDALPAGPVRVPDPATPTACRERRRLLAEALGDGLFVAEAGREGEGRFRSDDDFYWLTGVTAPDAVLVVVARDGRLADERLYLPAYDRRYEVWRGARLAPGEEASRRTGIADTRTRARLETELADVARGLPRLAGRGDVARELEERLGQKRVRTAPLLRPLQAAKDESELAAMRAAAAITQAALVDAMVVAVPGAFEFTAEAAVDGGFRRRGADGPAFDTICAAGPNACVLLYRENDRQLRAGELLVLDVGAELHHYCADLTRTLPVDGRFTPRQREIALLVWEAGHEAAELLRPGVVMREVHRATARFFEERGFGPAHFPHSVGHGLGLRVHDSPWPEDPLEPGMVVTIEPGLYLPDEGFGVRIENAYVVTDTGAECITDALPSHPDELQAVLAALRRR